MRVTLLTSWNLEGTAGSGVVTAVRGIRDSLAAAGASVGVVAPPRDAGGYLRTSLARIAFNHRLRPMDLAAADLVAGFDFDGFALDDVWAGPFVHVNGGTLADIMPFERGPVRWVLRQLAQLEKRAALRATAVVTPSAYAAGAVQHHYGVPAKRIHVVPYGIDLEKWDAGLAAAEPPPSDAPAVILCVAKLYPRKGVETLLTAFSDVARAVPSSRLEIVGDGNRAAAIDQLIAAHPARDRIARHGGVAHDAVQAFYRRAAVFCLPSRHETFGFAFLEAMASGLPVVALDRTATPELVADGETGLLAKTDEPRELAGLLIRLLQRPDEARALGEAGRARAAARPWSKTAHTLIALFQLLTGKPFNAD
jgi:glycosyltransferase involved in cell wall biosynthesis